MLHVAFLRAVNLGPTNKIPMKDLTKIFEAAGAADVRTVLNSGNVVFAAPAAKVPRIVRAVRAAITRDHGFDAPIVVRSASELAKVLRDNPFLRAKVDPDELHVSFLEEAPPAARVAALAEKVAPPEEVAVKGRDVYLRMPNGVGRSKLSAVLFERTLGTTSTWRNWRTVSRLAGLARAE